MSNQATIKKLERIEFNARRLLEDTAALKEELSGGSDSSNPQKLSLNHREQLLKKRRKTQLG